MNMQNLMAQAQKMKRDIEKKQEEINKTEYNASSGAVSVKINGKKELLEIKIDRTIINDSDDLDALEDMIKIALNDAHKQVDSDIKSKLGVYASGLNGLM